MIINHEHKFIFIKTKKTAGTSIEIALSKICKEGDIITPIIPEDEIARKKIADISAQNYTIPFSNYRKIDLLKSIYKGERLKFYHHMPAEEIKKYIPQEIWNSYYKFTIDRNPFDKIVSLYYWRGGDKKFNSIYDFLINDGLKGFSSYDIYAINGVVAVDKVYKFEDLVFFTEHLSQKLNLSTKIEMPSYRAKSKSRKKVNYRDILDEKSIDLLKTIFAREIQLLGYEF